MSGLSFSHEPAAWTATGSAIASLTFGLLNDDLTQGIVVAALVAVGGILTRASVRPLATSVARPIG